MRRTSLLASLLTGVLASSGCQPASQDMTDSHTEAIRDSVAATLSQFQRYSAATQWDSLGAMYSDAPAFRIFESGRLQYRSAAEVRAALSSLPPGTRIITEYQDSAIQPLAPGLALVSALFESTFSDSAGAGFAFGGAVTQLWVHEPGGWRILNGHSSSPVPRGG